MHKNTLQIIYKLLNASYGNQSWWPVTPTGSETPIYSGGPKTKKQILEVMVGAVLTQNTAWANAKKAIIELHRAKKLSIVGLLSIEEKGLAKLIKSSGYYNEKAKKLKELAIFLRKNPISALSNLDTETMRSKLLSIRGIGPETADSIILYGFKRPVFVVDAYTKRIISRVTGTPPKSYYELQSLFEGSIRRDYRIYNQYHALLVKHGKDYCKTEPRCGGCPLLKICHWGNTHQP